MMTSQESGLSWKSRLKEIRPPKDKKLHVFSHIQDLDLYIFIRNKRAGEEGAGVGTRKSS